MLKRLLFAATLVASPLLVTGTAVTGTAQASEPGGHASAQRVTVTSTMTSSCMWKDGCYKCYNYRTASWEIQSCDGDSGD
ncbi:hypothetical protein ACRYCC_24125 [Actinomadura scrupuli]|uniref:hypothetical protein n=1 Tax=Actinomadura scrupuli TaxID=559629 RepID=UPI003D967FF0